MAYQNTIWVDEVDEYEDLYIESSSSEVSGATKHTRYTGTVQQEGTLQNAEHFNNMEEGILDADIGGQILLKGHMDNVDRLEALETSTAIETGTVTLTNSLEFPFNNSQVTVSISDTRDNLYYVVEIISVTATGGPAGEIEITDRQVNGFKIAFTGSATSVTVVYAVIGGYDQ